MASAQGVIIGGSIADLPEPLALYLVGTNQATPIDPLPEPSAELASLEPNGETADLKPKRKRPRNHS